MKKFAFTLALALTCLLSAAQQPHKTLKERMKHGLSIEQIEKSVQNRLVFTQRFDSIVDFDGNERQVIKYTYDDHANLTARILEIYENNTFDYAHKNVYAYDDDNNCILEAELYNYGDGEWEEERKTEYTYDANGNCLSKTYSMWGDLSTKYLWTYDAANRCLTEEYLHYYSDDWHPSNRMENTYDAHGNLTLCLHQSTYTNGTLENSYKEEYSYDMNDNVILEVKYKWYTYEQEWEEDERTTYSYDANNNLICKMVYNGATEKTEYTYNEANLLILVVSTRFGSGNFWEKEFMSEYEYDQNDSLVMEVHYYGNSYYNEQGWHPNSKMEYVRNDAGYITCETESRTHSLSDDSLYYEFRRLYDYDNLNRLVCAIELDWRSSVNDFVYDGKLVTEFDANGNIENCIYYEYEDGEWYEDEGFRNTFDLTADAAYIMGLPLIYNEIFGGVSPFEENPVRNKWLTCRYNYGGSEDILITLCYSEYYDVNEASSSSLKVYSTEGAITIENDNITDIKVFDMHGRLVAQQNQVTQCRFNLKPGVYVVKAGNASVKAVVK